jgi:hypothetical protein
MRHPIKESPRNNGTAILLEDDASERSRNQPQAGGRRLATFWITVTLVAAPLTHFRAEIVAGETRYAGQVDADQAGAPAPATRKELAASAEKYRRALGEEQRTAVLARELTTTTEQLRRALNEERVRRAALASKLAAVESRQALDEDVWNAGRSEENASFMRRRTPAAFRRQRTD